MYVCVGQPTCVPLALLVPRARGALATLFAQQMAAQQQLANMRSGGALLPGSSDQNQNIEDANGESENRPGTYL